MEPYHVFKERLEQERIEEVNQRIRDARTFGAFAGLLAAASMIFLMPLTGLSSVELAKLLVAIVFGAWLCEKSRTVS